MPIRTFLSYIALALIIFAVGGLFSFYQAKNFPARKCEIFINGKDPANLLISSNCEVVTTNTTDLK